MALSLRLVVNGLSCQHVEFSGFGLKWIIIMTQPSENVLVKSEAVHVCVCESVCTQLSGVCVVIMTNLTVWCCCPLS